MDEKIEETVEKAEETGKEAVEETVETPVEETAEATNEVATEEAPKSSKKKAKKAEAELAEVRKSLEKMTAELAEMSDKYLRVCAEYDNFRKRSAKERESAYADAVCDTLTNILPVLDNLERAAQYNTDDSAESQMGRGLELTLKSFSELLSKMGVAEIEAEGKPFDPNVHNAVMHVEDETVGENQVVEVFMKGYAKGDKVLRYAMVKVAN
ncbi:MAG: nucleotide exchange factor GrpE [Clostridia bacterium]|nr:nucleotide exchange factor GrpE [Clostridia bacterium]